MTAVQHRDGFCLADNDADASEGATNIRTKCGRYVVLPFGFDDDDAATCHECIVASLEGDS